MDNSLKCAWPHAEATVVVQPSAEDSTDSGNEPEPEELLGARLDQPEDEATEHALRLMSEALRQGDAGRRWLVSENP